MSKLCKKCNLLYEDNIAFCPTCGSALQAYQEKRVCPKCSTALQDDWVACPNCGWRAENENGHSVSNPESYSADDTEAPKKKSFTVAAGIIVVAICFVVLVNLQVKSGNDSIGFGTKAMAFLGSSDAAFDVGASWAGNNENEKVYWYEKAARSGHARAQFLLGCCYYSGGDGTVKDIGKAYELFQKAADQGFPDAQYIVGEIYLFGDGMPKDEKKAFEYLSKAAAQNNKSALNQLGNCYTEGLGKKVDKKKGFDYYKRAAALGDGPALYNIGLSYELGDGVEKDLSKAAEYYRQSVEKGLFLGKFKLANMYQSGEGLPKDLKKAFDLFNSLAQTKYNRDDPKEKDCISKAMFRLATCYIEGLGVEADYNTAQYWFKEAENTKNSKY